MITMSMSSTVRVATTKLVNLYMQNYAMKALLLIELPLLMSAHHHRQR